LKSLANKHSTRSMAEASAHTGTARDACARDVHATSFLIRLVDIDHGMVQPLPGFDACFSPLNGEAVKLMPVIRIYGATPAGQKTLLHLHGVFSF
jgi:hypothetical protein